MAEGQTLNDLLKVLAEDRGFDLRGYKSTTLERRLHRRMHQLSIRSYDEYLNYIAQNHNETAKLLDTVLINVTRFFRDVQAWDVLAEQVLQALFKNRPLGTSFRVWCAGCATGEEPYSVAILLCELLGARVKDYEIKIYATDHDEAALTAARRAEYAPESLRGVRPELKEKYFTGQPVLRVVRDVRRMVIFGRSNLLTDAPISHVDLLLCRNVLIYFDATAQAHILSRLKYALNDGGVLFLGKSESQLKRNTEFIPINSRWRIFQRRSPDGTEWGENAGRRDMDSPSKESNSELERLRLYYETVLATLEPGVLVLDGRDTVITENDKIMKMWDITGQLSGKKLQETELWARCPELESHLEESRVNGPKTVQFDRRATPTTVVTITVKPIQSESGLGRVGTLIYMENVTSRVKLQSTIEELETTAEELETTNEELSSRTRELDEVNDRYSEMMERMPWPVLLVNDDTLVYMFNSAAQKLFGFAQPSEQGMKLQELPLDNKARQAILRRHRSVLQSKKQSNLKNCYLITNRFSGEADIHFTPLSTETGHGVIMMFQVNQPNKSPKSPAKKVKAKPAGKRKQPAKKRSAKKKARRK